MFRYDFLKCFSPLQAFTREGDHLYCQPTFRYYSSEMSTARFLTSNVEEEIEAQRGMVQQLNEEVRCGCVCLPTAMTGGCVCLPAAVRWLCVSSYSCEVAVCVFLQL